VEPKNFVPSDLLFEAYKFYGSKESSYTGERFTPRNGKSKGSKNFITTRNAMTPIKRDSLGKRQGSFVIEKLDSPFTSPMKKMHFEPTPFTQDSTPIRRNNQDRDVEYTPNSIVFNI
jgi:hypothetical protein